MYILYLISEDFSSRQNMNVLYLEGWQTYWLNEQEREEVQQEIIVLLHMSRIRWILIRMCWKEKYSCGGRKRCRRNAWFCTHHATEAAEKYFWKILFLRSSEGLPNTWMQWMHRNEWSSAKDTLSTLPYFTSRLTELNLKMLILNPYTI